MKIKKTINIFIVMIFLATIIYADDLCENKPTPCFKGLEGVNDKVEKLKNLGSENNYVALQRNSEDITVSIESLYEEASMYKNLALLRTQIEGLPKEVLQELKENKVEVPKKKSKKAAKKEEKTEEPAPATDKKATTSTITTEAETEPQASKNLRIDGKGPVNINIWFNEKKWKWCKTEYFSNNCEKEKELTSREISKSSSSKTENIGFDTKTYYEILSNLIDKDYKTGLDETIFKLVVFKVLKDKDINLVIDDKTKVSFDKTFDIVNIIVGKKEYKAIKIKYKEDTISSSDEKEIDELQKLGDYNKALEKIKELQTKY